MLSIKFYQRSEINEVLWNKALEASPVHLPYARIHYLDAVAENWGALVAGNYEAVMPIVWMNRIGFKLLYQPYYCQQLGIFGSVTHDKHLIDSFLNEVASYPYVNIQLNKCSGYTGCKALTERKNILLNLSRNYNDIRKEYTENHLRNISKATKAGLSYTNKLSYTAFLEFYMGNINRKAEKYKQKHESIFKKLSSVTLKNGSGSIHAVLNSSSEILAAVFMVKEKNRLCAIVNTSSKSGKQCGASHFLFDSIIQLHVGTQTILDFEGSSVPGIAKFYEGFGADVETYWAYKTSWLKF